MKFTIANITGGGDEIKKTFELRRLLEAPIQKWLVDSSFGDGIDEFCVVILATDSDPIENKRHYERNNKVGRYKDVITGKTVKFISCALMINPDLIISMTQDEFNKHFLSELIKKLDNPGLTVPKKFNYPEFKEKMLAVLELLRVADFK